ncbi:MAG TPA: Lrp/AsnC family transcriptional regulator [Steroidobacteraceae bacterium]|nr:Lrp/AsnC family transcriptional regulator [Steroidobacteraceae bacterium]
MDRTDRRILGLYQSDTRRVAASMAAEVGLSAAAVQRRIKRLRASGVIRAEIALLDPQALGVFMTCIVLLTLASRPGPVTHLARFKRDMLRLPEVQQCYQVTGTSDIVLIVTAASMEAYAAFSRRWFESNQHVTRYETLVVLDRVKVGVSLPIATDSPRKREGGR